MSQYELKLWPSPVLNKRCTPADPTDPELAEVVEIMKQIVEEKNGVGLGANQAGYLKRVIVVKLRNPPSKEDHLTEMYRTVVMVNPKITSKEGRQRTMEYCLSVPGVGMPVTRAQWIEVEYEPVGGGDKIVEDLSDGNAVVVQHEIDHLDGKTLADQPGVKKHGVEKGSNKLALENLKHKFQQRKAS